MEELWKQGEALKQGDINGSVLAFFRNQEFLMRHWMSEESSRQGRTVDRAIFIWDFWGLSRAHWKLKDLLGSAAKRMVDLYPETVQKVFLVNVAWIAAKLLWPFVSSLLHPVTKRKLSILDAGATRDGLLKEIDPTVLPRFLGGECTCDECSLRRLHNKVVACNCSLEEVRVG